jgi:regulator of nucleoside diphosphate kinase
MNALTHEIVLTHFDHHRLQGLLQVFRKRSGVDPWSLYALDLELRRARTVAPEAIPSDVVTMNSKVVLRDLMTGSSVPATLVFPDAWTHDRRNVPVLTPLGLALLGCRIGDLVTYSGRHGVQRLIIEEVEFQPEATGNYFM